MTLISSSVLIYNFPRLQWVFPYLYAGVAVIYSLNKRIRVIIIMRVSRQFVFTIIISRQARAQAGAVTPPEKFSACKITAGF